MLEIIAEYTCKDYARMEEVGRGFCRASKTWLGFGSKSHARMAVESDTYNGVLIPFNTVVTPGVEASTQRAFRERDS
ncbi:MAG: hypothetical protein KGL03_12375, partial [Nitrospirota bacterium]|nr:hypothetical protein [Nitrospirota bacterium]